MEAVLNNIPAAVVVVDEQDRVVMDNLAYKTFCAGPADSHRQDLFHAGRHSARGDLQLGEQLPAAAVGAEAPLAE
jgi:nitrogen-specific signal transduction histidine kinase